MNDQLEDEDASIATVAAGLLSKLARGRNEPLTNKELTQVQYWIDADWESHDIDRDAVNLIQRLLLTINRMPV